jgi:eukaryotic-like serine/threonine-protein kinase
METNAAHNLFGLTLKTGWKVIEKLTKTDNSSGSFFSVCYKVEMDGEICFLKAFDFAKFFQISEPGKDLVDIMGDMITAYQYERDLSNHCRNKHVTKVSFVREDGQEIIAGHSISIVPYLIFDLADCDVRNRLEFSNKLDFAWKLHSLHDIAVGLKQLHAIDVSHQDLKPSNILVFKLESKLGDLGRSICRDLDGPYNRLNFTGDINYAPPEIMYGYFDTDWHKRVFAIDCYLLGSMVVFYFAGISMSALLLKHIPENFRWEFWRGAFKEIKPYIADGFTKAIIEFRKSIEHPYFKKEVSEVVEHLCYPFPDGRGHPRTIEMRGSNLNLERFVARFDLLKRRAEYLIKN